MQDSLFADSLAPTRRPIPLLPACGPCGLFRGCQSPKMKLDGKGRKKILICAESPGRNEDEQGKPLVGASGDLLWSALAKFGVDRDDCWVINSARCRPERNKLPPKAIDHCRPLTVRDIEEKRPRVVILLGDAAVKSVIGWLWKDGDVGGIGRWAGWVIPSQQINAHICPTWHPASFLHGDNDERDNEVRKILFERHLNVACRLKDRPWNPVPDWQSEVIVETDHSDAAGMVERTIGERPVAFDFESTGLRPFNPKLDIYSCAVSDGRTTVSYPWIGDAIGATKELLESGTPKIGFNAKHEEVWCKRRLGVRVKNWIWDGMLAAHVLDNRPGVCGLDFQAFAVLGLGDFKSGTDAYLKADGGHAENRIRELPLRELLLRGGLDARTEFELWRRQRKLLGN